MIKFVIRVSSLVEEEYRTTMLHNDMGIFRLIVYVQQMEDSKLRKINRDGKRPRSDDPSQPKSRKRFYNQESSMGNKDTILEENSQ